MRKKVKHITKQIGADQCYLYTIEFEDGEKLQATNNPMSILPKLKYSEKIVDNYNFPDAGMYKILGTDYIYQNTYAIISTNTIQLIFYRQSDREQFSK